MAFYRDALGLEIGETEDVPSQRVRVNFVSVGGGEAVDGETALAREGRRVAGTGVTLELIEATSADSPIARYLEKRGPGLHHLTLRVDNIDAALATLKARGARLIDEKARVGAEGALVAFVHPSSAHGVLVELKEAAHGR